VSQRFFVLFFASFVLSTSVLCTAQAPFHGDFLPQSSFGMYDTWGIATGDFNGDGKLDLATTNPAESTVTIYTGNGDGTFATGATYTLTGKRNNPIWVATADFNGDGSLDLVVTSFNFADQNGGTLSVLLGNGDGTFQPEVDYAAGNHPTTVIAGDFNGDGKPDLAATDNGTAAILVLLNNGDGTFQPAQTYAVGTGPYSLASADFNGDGRTDLVVTNYCNVALVPIPSAFFCGDSPEYGNTVSVLLGNGDGTFQTQSTAFVFPAPYQVVTADFNQDGKADLVVTNGDNTYMLTVLLGNGDGTFQTPITYNVAGRLPQGFLVVGDFNGDGKLDIRNEETELLGNGDGTFQGGIDYGAGGYGPQIVGDFNQDGHPDVATSSVYIGVGLNAAGTTRNPTTTTIASSAFVCGGLYVSANVMNSIGPLPTGLVTLQVDGSYLSTFSPLNNTGNTPQIEISLFPGMHTITAVYAGDLYTQGSVGSTSITILYPTTITLTSSLNPSSAGQTVAFTVDISGDGVRFPFCDADGTVTFLDGTTMLGTIDVPSTFTLTTSALAPGSHSITANYSGGGYNLPGVSPILVQVVNPSLGLGVAPGGSNSATVDPGGTATYKLTIGAGGDTGNATLSCTGAPPGSTCSVPATLAVGNSVIPFTAMVTTTPSGSAALYSNPNRHFNPWFLALGIFGIIVLPGARCSRLPLLRRKRFLPLMLLILLLPACGGGGSNGGSGVTGSTSAGTYTLTVTAKLGSSVNQSLPLTLIVK
jgi:hypothetical protein